MAAERNSFDRFMERFGKDRSPYEILRIFHDVFEDGNCFTLARKYGIGKYDIRMIRQFPNYAALYVLNVQEHLGVYYRNNSPSTIVQFSFLKEAQ